MDRNMMDKDMSMDMSMGMSMGMYPNLVQMINNCEVTCEHMTHHLVMMKLVTTRMTQFGLLRDCSDICGLAARFISRGAYFSKVIADVCSEICYTCGNECLRYPDEMSQNCANICLECAKHCRQFSRGTQAK
ncbi:MAG: four-helix bundle copper-binding protein [Lachnotalea sp.]